MLLQTLVHRFACKPLYLVLSDIDVGVELLGHMTTVQSSEEPLEQFAKQLYHCIPTSSLANIPVSPLFDACRCLLPFVLSVHSPTVYMLGSH